MDKGEIVLEGTEAELFAKRLLQLKGRLSDVARRLEELNNVLFNFSEEQRKISGFIDPISRAFVTDV